MLKIYFTADSRYKLDKRFVKTYLKKQWQERDLPDGALSIAFVGSRKGRELAKTYLHEQVEHPVLTFPYLSHVRKFPNETEHLQGEIVICYPQVSLYAADKNQEINKVVSHFIDHALSIMVMERRKKA